MDVHDSYKETFTSWAVTTKETKVRGSDHRGEFSTGVGLSQPCWEGATKLNCNILWGKWTCLQGCQTVKGICTTKSQYIGMASVSDYVASVQMQTTSSSNKNVYKFIFY